MKLHELIIFSNLIVCISIDTLLQVCCSSSHALNSSLKNPWDRELPCRRKGWLCSFEPSGCHQTFLCVSCFKHRAQISNRWGETINPLLSALGSGGEALQGTQLKGCLVSCWEDPNQEWQLDLH